jgi:hypothetical protein
MLKNLLSNVEVVGLRLLHSSISTYETYPAKFKFQYEEKVPTASSRPLCPLATRCTRRRSFYEIPLR